MKIKEFEWNFVEKSKNSFFAAQPNDPFFRSFSVVFGRFRGHSWIWFRFLSVFIPFYSFLLHKHTNFSGKQNFFLKIFGSSKYSSYFCQRFTDDSRLSGRATVSPMDFSRRLFLCLGKSFFLTGKIIFSNWENRYAQYMAASWTVRFDLSSRISHHLVTNGECSRHPFLTKQVRC